MAFARDSYTATGGQTDFTITFPYQASEDVTVYQNGSLLTEGSGNDYTLPDSTTVRLTSGATADDAIVLERSTSRSTRDVTFTAGTLTENDLNNALIQVFYMAQEAIDQAQLAIRKATDDIWDALSIRIKNVADPTAAQDAATKNYVDTTVTTLGNVPAPDNPGEDNYLLAASAGSWDWAVPVAPAPADPGDDGKFLKAASGVGTWDTVSQPTVRDPTSDTTSDYQYSTSKNTVKTTAGQPSSEDETGGYKIGSRITLADSSNYNGTTYTAYSTDGSTIAGWKAQANTFARTNAPTTQDGPGEALGAGSFQVDINAQQGYINADNVDSGVWIEVTNEWELIDTLDVTAAASMDLTSLLTTGYDYRFVGRNILTSTAVAKLWMRTSTDNGSTFDSGATDYAHANWSNSTSNGSGSLNPTSDTKIVLNGNGGGDSECGYQANDCMSFDMVVNNPKGTGKSVPFVWSAGGTRDNGQTAWVSNGCGIRQATTDIDAVQFLWSTGNNFAASGQILTYKRRIR